MADAVLPKLVQKTSSIDVNLRHGSVLAIGELVVALKILEVNENVLGKYINTEITGNLNQLVISFQKRDQFKGKHYSVSIWHAAIENDGSNN